MSGLIRRVAGCVLIPLLPVLLAAGSRMGVGTGFEYGVGDYGGEVDIESTYVPLLVFYENGPWWADLKIPWLELRAPDDTIIIGGGNVSAGADGLKTKSGLGNIELEVGYITDWFPSEWFSMNLLGEITFPTGDRDKGLSTGKTDLRLEAQFFKTFGHVTPMAFVAYIMRGEPAGTVLNDVLGLAAGLDFRVSPSLSLGAIFEYEGRVAPWSPSLQKLEGYLKYRADAQWTWIGYIDHGFTDASPRFGIGAEIQFRF